jgi:hypothetical protein
MKRGLRGQFLPESPEDFAELQVTGFLGYAHCHVCHDSFSGTNVFTPAGWAETQISGTCESCFDRLFCDDEGL